jgi:hypothetical protein
MGPMKLQLRLPLLAAAIALPSWVAVIVLLGNVDLQRSVSVGLFLPLERPIVLLAVGLVAFAPGFVGGRMARVGLTDLVPLGAWLAVANLVAALAATVLVDELELPNTPIVFIVLSAYGALYVGGLVGAWLATHADVR